MYELKRAERIQEQIKLGDEILTVDLDPETLIREINKRSAAVIRAEQDIRAIQEKGEKVSDALLEIYGNAFTQLMGVVFGDENTEKIVRFYDARYLEMTEMIYPFITETIMPQVAKLRDRILKREAKKYRANRRFG